MNRQSHAFRAGPEAHDRIAPQPRPDALPHDTALIHRTIRTSSPPFMVLSRPAWVVFQALAFFLGRRDFAYPTQTTIGRHAGYSARAVRRALTELRLGRLVVTWTVRDAEGRHGPLHYAYGPAALAAFREVATRYPRSPEGRAKPLPRKTTPADPPAFPSLPAAKIAAEPSASLADKPILNSFEPSFKRPDPDPVIVSAPAKQNPEFSISSEDRELAREALTYRSRRLRPRHAPPIGFDASVIELVALRSAQTPGDRDAKLAALRLAIDGSILASPHRPPTVRFTFEAQDHYEAHVDRGRAKALGDARAARARTAGPSGAPPPVRAVSASAEAVQVASNRAHAEALIAKLAALGGP